MSLKESALKTIETGAWTFDVLAPRFRSALVGRILSAQDGRGESLENRSLMELTLRAYEPRIVRSWQGFKNQGRFLDRASGDDLTVQALIAEKVFGGGTPSSFSSSDLTLISQAEAYLRQASPTVASLKDRWAPSFMKLANVGFRSGSHPHAFGCIFFGDRISEFSVPEVATSIVHELAHQELFLLNLVDRLVESDADFKLVHAPFQGTKRPTIGRLHSLYALFRMVEFQRALGLLSTRHSDMLLATSQTFDPRDLTEYGERLVNAVVARTNAGIALKNAGNV